MVSQIFTLLLFMSARCYVVALFVDTVGAFDAAIGACRLFDSTATEGVQTCKRPGSPILKSDHVARPATDRVGSALSTFHGGALAPLRGGRRRRPPP